MNTSPASLKEAIKGFLKRLGAGKIKRFGVRLRNNLVYRGNKLFCPVCGRSSSRFMPFGNPPRPNAECVWCGAKARHRFVWLFWLSGRSDLFAKIPGRKFLHVAPEIFFERKLRELIGGGYVTDDFSASYADIRMEIQDIQYADDTFDILYCNGQTAAIKADPKVAPIVAKLEAVRKSMSLPSGPVSAR